MSTQTSLYVPISAELYNGIVLKHAPSTDPSKVIEDCLRMHLLGPRPTKGQQDLLPKSSVPSISAELEQKIRVVIDKYWGGKLYMKIPHPAFDSWPATYGFERWDMVKRHLVPAGGTALDIGANFGAFSHLLEDFGYNVTAVEISRDHADIIQDIRDFAGKQFKVLCQSIFDIGDTNFDLVIAFNVFHHFLKQQDSYESLIAFLNRLNCKTFIFQGHDPTEAQMEGAYRNFHPNEFSEFVRDKAGLSKIECIGGTGARKIFKIT